MIVDGQIVVRRTNHES